MTVHPPEPPPSKVRDLQRLTSSPWLWNWIPPVFPNSPQIRPSDMDGWVEHSGQILLLDACIGWQGRAGKPSTAVERAVAAAGNVTYLAMSADADDFDTEAHTPSRVSHYLLVPAAGWTPTAWRLREWTPVAPHSESLWRMVAMIAQWAAWTAERRGGAS